MAWFRKPGDPLDAKFRSLDKKLSSVQQEIRQLTLQLDGDSPEETQSANGKTPPAKAPAKGDSKPDPQPAATRSPFTGPARTQPEQNDFQQAVQFFKRLWGRIRDGRGGDRSDRVRLVNYLAAGSFEGMRPLRYERRIARNRAIFLIVCVALVILAIVFHFWPL